MINSEELSEEQLDIVWRDQAETVEEIKDKWLSELESIQEEGSGSTQELKRKYNNAVAALHTLEREYDRRDDTEPPTEIPTPWDEIAELIRENWTTSESLTPRTQSQKEVLEDEEEFRDRLTDIDYVTDGRAEKLIAYFEEKVGESDYEGPLEIIEKESPVHIRGVGPTIWNDTKKEVRDFYGRGET